MKTEILRPTQSNIRLCANTLKNGGLVAFPTETVYGLGANALDEAAVKSIYDAKGRPSDNPLIVHLGDKKDIEKYADISKNAKLVIDEFMPGPITILLRKKPCIPDIVTGGKNTVGVRIPSNLVATKLLCAADIPVCAPSANTSTRPSPTIAQHVYDDLDGKIGYILDGGSCDIGIESTIIDLSAGIPTLLRKGRISSSQLEAVLGESVVVADYSSEASSPGLKYKHYAPKAKIIMVRNSQASIEVISKMFAAQTSLGCKTAILCYNSDVVKFPSSAAMSVGDDDAEYSKCFYGKLRQLDKEGFDVIICHAPKEVGIGLALFNRMFKAAGETIFEAE